MTFKELVDHSSLENKIKFQKQIIQEQISDIEKNGDNGFGYKKRQLENMKNDLVKLENEYKTINK